MDAKSLLFTLFSPRDRHAPQPGAKAGSGHTAFQSVSIQRGPKGCCAAKELEEVRFLAKLAPALPLATCTMQGQCQCRYVKHSDRREDARRLMDVGRSALVFDNHERRRRAGRRRTD